MNQVEYLINIQQQIWKPQGRSETRRRRVPACPVLPPPAGGWARRFPGLRRQRLPTPPNASGPTRSSRLPGIPRRTSPPREFSPSSSSRSTRTPRSLGHLSSHCSGGLARPRASRSRLDARSSPPSTAQRPGEVASGAKSRLSEPEGLPGPWGLQPQATAAERLLLQLPR